MCIYFIVIVDLFKGREVKKGDCKFLYKKKK